MSLLSSLIATANSLTQSFGLQATITYYAYQSSGGSGRDVYADPVSKQVIYERKVKQVRKFDGELGISNAQITFLDATIISEFDKLVLPDGTTQPVIGIDSVVDVSNAAVLTQVYLG